MKFFTTKNNVDGGILHINLTDIQYISFLEETKDDSTKIIYSSLYITFKGHGQIQINYNKKKQRQELKRIHEDLIKALENCIDVNKK